MLYSFDIWTLLAAQCIKVADGSDIEKQINNLKKHNKIFKQETMTKHIQK